MSLELKEAYGFASEGGLTYSSQPCDIHETLCGLCEKNGATIFWRTDKSYVIHPLCLTELKPFLDLIEKKLNEAFPLETQGSLKLNAQIQALTALRPHLDSKSMIVFSQKDSKELIRLIEKVAFPMIEILQSQNKLFS